MTDRGQLPELSPSALRDPATAERIDRVWLRLREELPARASRSRPMVWWVPAAIVVVFASGVFVGSRVLQPRSELVLGAEPRLAFPPAAGPEATTSREQRRTQPSRVVRRRGLSTTPFESDGPVVESVEPGESASTAAVTQAAPSGPEWQRQADLGEYTEAWKALEQQGGFDAALNGASAEQLMSLVDIARTARQRGRALQALRRIVDRFPNAPEAPSAAWTLGNMLENAGDRAGALEAFALYKRLSPTGDFAEDAAAREVEVAMEQNDLQKARELADRYAKEFPSGQRLRQLQKQLVQLSSGASDEGSEATEGLLDGDESLESPASGSP